MPRYYAWIMSVFRPHIGKLVVEFGAGLGAISKHIFPHVEVLQLIGPSPNLAAILQQRFSGYSNVTIYEETLEGFLARQESNNNDTTVLVNVLEHIENDAQVLRGIRAQLRDGGKLLLFVPATPFLFSKLDARFGHYRRYVLSDIRILIEQNGFRIQRAFYMDILGMVPWWLVNTIGGQTEFNPFLVRLYDYIGIPLTRFFEGIVQPPIGKNIVVIAEKHSLPMEH